MDARSKVQVLDNDPFELTLRCDPWSWEVALMCDHDTAAVGWVGTGRLPDQDFANPHQRTRYATRNLHFAGEIDFGCLCGAQQQYSR